MGKVFFFLFLIYLSIVPKAIAQFSDSLRITVGATTTVASNDFLPLWIKSMKFGTISDEGEDVSLHFLIGNTHTFGVKSAERGDDISIDSKKLRLSYLIDIYNNAHFQKTFTKEAYIKLGYKSLELRGGRYAEVVGEVDSQLSSGSFAISGNALPIPKIGIALTEYVPVPLTNELFHVKGQYSHGWLGKTNFVKNSYLHEKAVYFKIGKKRFNFYGGLHHFAQWGGTHPKGKTPQRLKDYFRIVTGSAGDSEDSIYHQGPIDIVNAVGNHMITSDMGIEFKIKASILKLYTQTIFEKGRGDSANINRRDDLIGLNIGGSDRLVGLSWEIRKKSFVEKVLFEGLYTKDQGGPVIFYGRFNYYNNATYETGWVYHDQTIGTPLFITLKDAPNYNLNLKKEESWNIVSNRIIGFHTGLQGSLSKKIRYRCLMTYVQHYGNYYNDKNFTPFKKQAHLLGELSYQLNPSFHLSTAVGVDSGESDNSGGSLSLQWKLK